MWFDNTFERAFRRMSDHFSDLDDIFESDQQWNNVNTYGPYYYGYQIALGNDGKPIVREYGNVRPGLLPTSKVREPFVDQIFDKDAKTLKLVAEMPGIEKKDINVTVEGRNVHIKAEHDKRKYETKTPLQHKVDQNSVKAAYSNGILEVTFKVLDQIPQGKTIPVE